MLAMTHVCHSTPTAGPEAALDVMSLDLYVQCKAVQAVLRVRSRNQSSWDGIGCGHLRGHLFWGDNILKGVEIMGVCTDKREIKDLFYDRWKVRWTCLSTCCQTKFWLEDPGSLGNALAHLDHPTLGLALQAITEHNYLYYHHNVTGNISEQICRFCQEKHEEFIHLVCKCPALARVCLDTVQGHQHNRQPLELYGLVRLMKVDLIGKAMERRAEQVKFTGELTTPDINVH